MATFYLDTVYTREGTNVKRCDVITDSILLKQMLDKVTESVLTNDVLPLMTALSIQIMEQILARKLPMWKYTKHSLSGSTLVLSLIHI